MSSLRSSLRNSLTSSVISSLAQPSISIIQRIFITLDAAANGHYVLASTWTATTNYTITGKISTTTTSGALVSSFTDVNNNYAILLTAGGFLQYVSEVAGVTTTKTGTVVANAGDFPDWEVKFLGTTLTITVGGVTDTFLSVPVDGAIVDDFGSQNGANFLDMTVLADIKLADDATSNNTFTFALDEATSNTETAAEGGNSVTYTNIPTGAPDRELFTFGDDDWVNAFWANLLLWSEGSNLVWNDAGVTQTPNTSIAPDGTLTADRVQYAGSLGSPQLKRLEQVVALLGGTASKTLTDSFFIKATSGTSKFRLKNTHGGVADNFSSDFTATSEFQRFDFTVTNSASAGSGSQSVAIIAATDDSAFDLQVWGAQLEIGNTATTYKKITDVPGRILEGV
jgi:hypothetical protein